MGRLAFAVLLLSLEIAGRASPSNADTGLAGEASLGSGVVPPSQLGSGVANASTCLNANSTWGSCGGGSPAGITYATPAQDWTQTISITLTGGTQAKVTLTPCPTGIDTTSGASYQVLISGGGNSEAVNVVSGRDAQQEERKVPLIDSHLDHPLDLSAAKLPPEQEVPGGFLGGDDFSPTM